jgi:hypothetical protein
VSVPEHGFFEWHSAKDRDLTAVSLIVAAILDDDRAAERVLGALSHEQAIVTLWVVTKWHSKAIGRDRVVDPLGALRAYAIQLASDEETE